MVFCRGLREVCFGCIVDVKDLRYLVDHREIFSGLSNVKKLSLAVEFKLSKGARSRWNSATGKQWVGGNLKTTLASYLLEVTKNLDSLELSYWSEPPTPEDFTSVNSSCIVALGQSFKSLRHLRLIGIDVDTTDLDSVKTTDLSLFENLKMLSVDYLMSTALVNFPMIQLPLGIEILSFPYYNPDIVSEDLGRAHFLKRRNLPRLELLVLPLAPVGRNGELLHSEDFKKGWIQGRIALEKEEVFTSGKAKLRLVNLGEYSEYLLQSLNALETFCV